MNKIKIITDSTSYITREFANENNLAVVQLNYTFEEDTKLEGYPGEFNDFYERLSKSNSFPTTSQPAVGDFLLEYERALMDHDEILVITLSSKLSGTFNSALNARRMVDDERVTVIDSLQTAGNLKFLVEEAVHMANNEMNIIDIVKAIENKKKNMGIFLTINNLEYLRKGGRLSSIQSFIGSVLNIKPIIELKDGELNLVEKTRGKKKALNTLLNRVPSQVKKLSISHILNDEEALELKGLFEARYKNVSITIDEIGPIIGTHLGPGALGVCFDY